MRLPTFIYMDDYRIFTGSAQLDQVQQRFKKNQATDEDYTIRLIMEQAGLDVDEEVEKGNAADREQRMLDMNDASLTLTNEIADRWSQKKYEIRFEADGQQLIMFVKDADSAALVPLEERSKGFQWFFSFDMLFMSETSGDFENSVILLDEPGLHLHAAAQRDLLDRMKEYAKENQLVYTTHLPFMVDFTRLDSIFICEEKQSEPHYLLADCDPAQCVSLGPRAEDLTGGLVLDVECAAAARHTQFEMRRFQCDRIGHRCPDDLVAARRRPGLSIDQALH